MKKSLYNINSRAGGFLLAAGLALAGSAVAFNLHAKDKTDRPPVNIQMDESAVNRDTLPRGSYANVIKKVSPAVVKIVTTTRIEANNAQQMPGFDDPFWRRFFGDQFGGVPRGQAAPQVQHGLGSGVIVTKDGYIMTNNHVVDGAKEVKVTLQDGREFTAKVMGRDPKSDIAVVKVDATDLPTVSLADSEKVEVGDVVLAIGNPFGVGQTTTQGIVSALGRNRLGLTLYENFIQTDAAINPGNSGGALIDTRGDLVGINTAIYSDTGGSLGIGFAIPAAVAHNILDQIIEHGSVRRGWLGLEPQDITPDLARAFHLKQTEGAIVARILRDGPADRAGIHVGDIIRTLDGKPVADAVDLLTRLAPLKPGTEVKVEILRDGRMLQRTAKVGLRPPAQRR